MVSKNDSEENSSIKEKKSADIKDIPNKQMADTKQDGKQLINATAIAGKKLEKKNPENNKKESEPASKAAAGISTRKIETVRSVEIKSDSLLLTLYDNGEIDGDTVSVLLNGKVIMPLQGADSKRNK